MPLRGVNQDVHVAPAGRRVINPSGMKARRIKLHNFIACPHPIESSVRLRPKGASQHHNPKHAQT